MKIIHTEEMDIIKALEELNINRDNNYMDANQITCDEWHDLMNFYRTLDNFEQENVYILAKAFKPDNLWELQEMYKDYADYNITEIYCEHDINEIYKTIIKNNLLELAKIDNNNAFWDFYDFETFGEYDKEFHRIGECDFNDNHYFVVKKIQ